nr:EF-hand domain-containing family member C2-like [Lepeophtheirus salmonis]
MIPGKVGIGKRPLENERCDTWTFGEKTQTNQIPGSLPKWLVNDKKILRFWSYLIEPISEGGLGTSLKRRFNVYYFLEDDSIKVTEIHSSMGRVSHETFIRRHRIPFKGNKFRLKPNDPYINFWDLNLGFELELYGRAHVITDCDPFTTSYLTKCGVQMNPSIAEMPDRCS